MRKFIYTTKGKIVVGILVVVLCAALYFAIWCFFQPKFKDVTIELGEPIPDVSAFMTNGAVKAWCSFVTNLDEIDFTAAGDYSIDLRHGITKEKITLHIVDTTAPVVEFKDVVIHIDDALSADAFVVYVEDLSETTVAFATQPQKPKTFGKDSVTVLVTDASGNQTEGICNVEYVWIVPFYTLELGDVLDRVDLKPYSDKQTVLSQDWIDMVNKSAVGSYTFTSSYNENLCDCTVTIQDTTPPDVVVKDLTVFTGDSVFVEDFIVSIFDVSGEYSITTDDNLTTDTVCQRSVQITVTDSSGNQTIIPVQFQVIADTEPPIFSGLDPLRVEQGTSVDYETGVFAKDNRDAEIFFTYDASAVDVTTLGTYYIQYAATDRSGNQTEVSREITVVEDSTPPVFSGLTDMKVEKNTSPDFLKGVTAVDSRDGTVRFTFNSQSINMSKAGTYYITYTAVDAAGNTATAQRKIVVNYDASDVALLVAELASTLSDDPEELRNYVRSTIGYNRSWGGDSPVWYGFKNKVGNCYVHALCLQSLFNEKGIENMLIWDTDKSHYWNLVKIDGQWKHIDSTPSRPHTTYSLMNDKQRYETLISGNWDRTQWPVCN